jgi:hypothetical protein
MGLTDLTFAEWNRLSDEVARRECEALARMLPHGLKLTSLQNHDYCGRTHRVARFSRREAGDLVHYALIPGGRAQLGFDGNSFKPRPWQVQSYARWQDVQIRQGAHARYIKATVEKHIHYSTTAPREVDLPTILVEIEAKEPVPRDDLIPLKEDDPVYERFLNQEWRENGHSEPYSYEAYDGIVGRVQHVVDALTRAFTSGGDPQPP